MFAKKEVSVYKEREKNLAKKNINELVQATDSIINFYLNHPVYPADPDLLDTDPPKKFIKILNVKAENLSITVLIIGTRNYRENYITIDQQNKETNFHNLTDPKA